MKKQIYGITLFIAIVSFSVFIYEYFSYNDEPDCGKVMSARCVSTAEPLILKDDNFGNNKAEDVFVDLRYIQANMRSRTVKTRIRMEWNGDGEPPEAVWLQIQFHNFDGSNAGWTSDPFRIADPFRKGDGIAIENSFDCGRCTDLPRNLYASATVWNRANIDRKLVYEIGKMTPVLIQEQR